MEPEVRERSVTDLVREIMEDAQRLVRDEVQLARTEIVQSLQDMAVGLGAIVAAGMFVLLAVAFVGVAIFFALALTIPLWAAGLVVVAIYLILTAVAGYAGYRLLQPSRLKPEQTIESLEEDREWIERHRR